MKVSRTRSVLVTALAYAVVGVVTADFAIGTASPIGRSAWRLAAWVLSFIVFVAQLRYERRRDGTTVARTARDVAIAAAIGAFALAVAGPVRSHWHSADLGRAAILSLVAWPLLVGIPAYIAALVIGFLLDRVMARGGSTAS